MMWIMAILLSLLTMLAEWALVFREKRVENALEETVEHPLFHRALFGMAMGALLVSFLVTFSHRVGVTPRQGVAILVDTNSFGEKTPLSAIRGPINELLENLGGIPCSLYEISGGTLERVVPRTFDRIFYNLLLDSLEEREPRIKMAPLYDIQEELRKISTRIMPWIVVVTADEPVTGGRLDGLSCISMNGVKSQIRTWTGGVEAQVSSIADAAGVIEEYLSRSETPLGETSIDMWLLVCSTGMAFFSYLYWRKYVVAIGTAVFVMGSLYAQTPTDENWAFSRAEELAEGGSLDASQDAIEAILSTTTDPLARRRLLFDRALLSYLKRNDDEAVVWLSMEAKTPTDRPLAEKINTLQASLFLRLIDETVGKERQRWKDRLQEWLGSHPPLSPELSDLLAIALSSPQPHPDELLETLKTFVWLDLGTRFPLDMSWPSQVASSLAERTKGQVSKKLQTLSSALPPLFMQDLARMVGAEGIVRLRIWYSLALTASPENGITQLLEEAANASQDGLSFPFRAPVSKRTLVFVESLLRELQERVAPQKAHLLKLLLQSNGDPALWYASSVLWSALQEWDGKTVQPLAQLACRQLDANVSPKGQAVLARCIREVYPLSLQVSDRNSLQELVSALLLQWYVENPSAAIEEILAHITPENSEWNTRFIHFMGPILKQATQSANRLAAAVAKGVGTQIESYDLSVVGRLWQVAITEMTSAMGAAHNLDHLIMAFQTIQKELTSGKGLQSLCLLIAVYPLIGDDLGNVSFFSNDATRSQYQEDLDDWMSACQDIQSRIESPATFRIPRVEVALAQAVDALMRMRSLLEEGVAPQPTYGGVGGGFQGEGAARVRPADAVRLFQEMDRSDRKLLEG